MGPFVHDVGAGVSGLLGSQIVGGGGDMEVGKVKLGVGREVFGEMEGRGVSEDGRLVMFGQVCAGGKGREERKVMEVMTRREGGMRKK